MGCKTLVIYTFHMQIKIYYHSFASLFYCSVEGI